MNEKTDRKKYMKKWQQDNKEKTREYAKRYYYKNIDKIKEKRQSNEYKEKYREYKREWAKENRKTQKEIINNLQSKIDKTNRILNANTHVENIYHALCNLFDEEYQYEIDNEELNEILKGDK